MGFFQKLSEVKTFKTSKYEELSKNGFVKFKLNPKQNYKVEYFYIDFAFPEKKVGIEVDSYKWHTDKARDLRRHNFLKGRGWTLYHFNTTIIRRNPCLPAAYVYLKHYNTDKELIRQAEFEVYKLARFYMTDQEQKDKLNEILN